jgi:hypothetical protein
MERLGFLKSDSHLGRIALRQAYRHAPPVGCLLYGSGKQGL